MILRRLATLIDAWAPRISAAFTASIADLRERVQVSFVAEQLQTAGVDAAVRAVGIAPVMFRQIDAALEQAFEGGGRATVQAIPPARDDHGGLIRTAFDIRSGSAERWLREHSALLVREITEDQRTTIRQHLVAGMEAGTNPRTVALDLVGRINPSTGKRAGGVLGLTSTQETWARNYADELAAGDAAALNRKLRDPRYDGTVRKAIAAGEPLSPERIAKMVAAYRNRALKARAETLVITEATTALHQAREEAVEQAIGAGQVDLRAVRKRWKDSGDSRVRDTHQHLNGAVVPFRSTFLSSSGARLRYPGDASAPAAERIGCRCDLEILL